MIYLTKNNTPITRDPLLTFLSYSGGQQSACLLWMVIRGDIEKPDNFVVINADPGMENSGTYMYNARMKAECEKAGIEYRLAPGPNLYEDMVALSSTSKTRLDTPAYWTKSPAGKKGRLHQQCTFRYKITPIYQEVRRILQEKYNISAKSKRIGNNVVQSWIGFSYDEIQRMKPPDAYYRYYRYPLVERKMKKEDVIQYFKDNNLPTPPRSVCNACFANGLKTLKEMYVNRPDDWDQAIRVDEAVRDWSQIGVRDEVYVSSSLIPLKELPERNFLEEDMDKGDWSCDSGFCFV